MRLRADAAAAVSIVNGVKTASTSLRTVVHAVRSALHCCEKDVKMTAIAKRRCVKTGGYRCAISLSTPIDLKPVRRHCSRIPSSYVFCFFKYVRIFKYFILAYVNKQFKALFFSFLSNGS